MADEQFTTIDEYIGLFSGDVRERLEQIRKTVHEAAPDAQEKISYKMPTFHFHENLVHFAAFKSHIGLYPGVKAIEEFTGRLAEYKTSKGAIQFPLSKPVPYELIGEITRFRVRESLQKHGK